MKRKWVITLNVFSLWIFHLIILWFGMPSSRGLFDFEPLLWIFSFIVSLCVGFLVLAVSHFMKKFDCKAKNPQASIGIIITLLIFCIGYSVIWVPLAQQRKQENRAMIDAAETGNTEAVKQLIADGAAVNAKDHRGRTPLHRAAINSHKETVELLLAKGADVNAKARNGSTPLHPAVGGGYKETVELLIAKGADVNAKDDDGGTPLHSAASEGQKESAELLIDKGADVNAKRKGGETPLDQAKRHPETAALLRKHGGKTGDWFKAGESIHKAARVGHIEAVKQHLANGEDVNAKNKYGNTPLHIAAKEGKMETIELLIAEGADVNLKTKKVGWTPLHSAASDGHKGSC